MVEIDLTGKTAIVTGGGQGLGAETASLLAKAGADVVVNFFADSGGRNRELAEQTAAAIGKKAITAAADVRDLHAVKTMFEDVMARFGKVDIVVNNAGIIRDKSIKKMSPDDWHAVIDTNLTGVFNVCKTAAETIADGGRIVNITSISGYMGFFGQANYSASKAGVVGLTKVLSRELARRAVTVNAVAPGVALTEMGKSIPDEVRQNMLASIPLGRFSEPSEISNVVLFLASDLASYVTGQTIHVNGGWYV